MATTLENAFEWLKRLPFPEFAEGEELGNWQANLAELDGHIAGIAATVLAGGHTASSMLPRQVAALRQQLESMSDILEEDREILAECRKYLDALEEVVRSLKQ